MFKRSCEALLLFFIALKLKCLIYVLFYNKNQDSRRPLSCANSKNGTLFCGHFEMAFSQEPKDCDATVEILILVLSASQNIQRRNELRQSLLQWPELSQAKCLFLLGKSPNLPTENHQDILQLQHSGFFATIFVSL